MRIAGLQTDQTPAGARIRAGLVWTDRRTERIEFVYRGLDPAALTGAADAALAAMLIPAMAAGEDITVEAPVSARLLAGAADIVAINCGWHPSWHPTRVDATAVERPPRREAEVASLFSGGVDSFHTLLSPRADPITTVFTIVGFDLRFEKRRSAPSIVARLDEAAAAAGRRMIVVDSNAYELGHGYLFRAEHHGGFLAATVLGVGDMVRRCYIPGSWTIADAPPSGSHPLVDHLWSTEQVEFVHDGVGISRVQKGLAIAGNPLVLAHLRVCARRPDLYNCGRCAKCVTTALTLHVAGTLGRCATLPAVDYGTVARADLGAFVRPYRELAGLVAEPRLRRAVRRALRMNGVRRAADPLVDVLRRRRLRARLRRHADTF